MTAKRPKPRTSTRSRGRAEPLERAIPLHTTSELRPLDDAADERRRLIDDSWLRERRRVMLDAIVPLDDLPSPDVYAWDDAFVEAEPGADRLHGLSRRNADDPDQT